MTVTDCIVGTSPLSANAVAGIVEVSDGQPDEENPLSTVYRALAGAGTLCNAAEIDATTMNLPAEQKKIMGDATDQAILRFAETIGNTFSTRQAWKTIYRVPFNSKDKYMLHVAEPFKPVATSGVRTMTLFIKGAPDILIKNCTTYLTAEGESAEMDTLQMATIENVKDSWSTDAKRVILVARKSLPSNLTLIDPQSLEFENAIAEQASKGLEFVGMLAMIDPPREEIPDVVRTLRGAGIRVHMVTGDFKLTAQAIAVQCGIITLPSDRVDDISALGDFESSWSGPGVEEKDVNSSTSNEASKRSIVISGSDLRDLSPQQWNVLCAYEEIVFARTTPEQKLRIVKELQARGETVASSFTPFFRLMFPN
jgi:sodium/potassium-transporting ATPase subunit alpha